MKEATTAREPKIAEEIDGSEGAEVAKEPAAAKETKVARDIMIAKEDPVAKEQVVRERTNSRQAADGRKGMTAAKEPATAKDHAAATRETPSSLIHLAALETVAPQFPPLQTPRDPGPSHIPSIGARTSLVDFETAPFPYHGAVPGSNRPFLSAGEDGHRGHVNFRGRVFWESADFQRRPRAAAHPARLRSYSARR